MLRMIVEMVLHNLPQAFLHVLRPLDNGDNKIPLLYQTFFFFSNFDYCQCQLLK